MEMAEQRSCAGVSNFTAYDRECRLEAARLLGRLKARANSKINGGATLEASLPVAAMLPYWREHNLAGVYLHRAVDGWYAEIHFKNVPEGLAPILGTPPHQPCASEAEALEHATGWLVMVLAAESGNLMKRHMPSSDERDRFFHLDGLTIRLNARALHIAARAATIARVSPECAEARLHLLLATDFPAGVTAAGWSGLQSNRRMLYLGWIGLLLAHGQTRFHRMSPIIEQQACSPRSEIDTV